MVFIYWVKLNILYITRFGESTLNSLLKWVTKLEGFEKNSKILDIGTGNGITLVELVVVPYTFTNVRVKKDFAIYTEVIIARKQLILPNRLQIRKD